MIDTAFRRLVLAGAGLLALAAPAAAQQKMCHPDGKPTEPEVIFNSSGGTYGEAIQKVFFTPFEQECGIKVRHVNSQRNYAQMRLFVQSGNLPWDMGATVADQEFPLGIKDGILHKLPAGFWKGMEAEMIPGSIHDYGAWATPYSNVIVYSPKTFPNGGPKSWAEVWDVQKFPGPRALYNRPTMLVAALLADGVPRDKIYPMDLDRAFRKLDQLRPHIRAFFPAADNGVQGVANGEFVISTALSGRAAVAVREQKPVEITWEDAVLQISWTFILKGTPRPRAAEALLYYMQRADRQAELGKITGYTGGNKNAVGLMEADVAKMLPATPDKIAISSVIDATWWADNNARVFQRWDAWVASGK